MSSIKKKNTFRLLIILILLTTLIPVIKMGTSFHIYDFSYNNENIYKVCKELNLNNMVTYLYLGPRMSDTFFEALIVVITALSMEYFWRKK